MSEALEAAGLHRIMDLNGQQYAFRRSRRAETHPFEFHDFVGGAQLTDLYAYIASVDVDGAFDAPLHSFLVRTVGDRGIKPFLCRYARSWYSRRVFSVRLASSKGRYFSNLRTIRSGVPSPFLWLMQTMCCDW